MHDVAPIVTFDQPQKWKAFTIRSNEQQESKLDNIIHRLGGGGGGGGGGGSLLEWAAWLPLILSWKTLV